MPFVEPQPEQMQALMNMPQDRPFVFLNFLKFDPDGGRELYARYAKTSTRLIYELGGRYVFYGKPRLNLIGPASGEDWEEMVLAYYPTLAAFFQMVGMEEYKQAVQDRHNGVIDSRLVIIEQRPEKETPGWPF